MTYLFSDIGRAHLEDFVDCETLFAFDLDGTLAPIAADPGGIVISEALRRQLTALNQLTSVAVITGRSRTDALAHLGFTPAFLVGSHGAEGLPGREEFEHDYVLHTRGWKELLVLLPVMNSKGIVIEDKGATLSLHYRNAPDPDRALREILAIIPQLQPTPRLVAGKFVLNLVPMGAPHKGEALLAIMGHLGFNRALFVGDDETDEDVFRLGDDRILSARVGSTVISAADYCLYNQNEIGGLLDLIIAVLAHHAGCISGKNLPDRN